MTLTRTLTQTHPHVWRLIAPNASPMTGPGTNTYLVGSRAHLAIIDPGPAENAHIDDILQALETLQVKQTSVMVTHHHSDHAAYAQQLADRLNVPLLSLNHPFQHEDDIQLDNVRLRVLHTPGHTYVHACFYLVEQKLLLAGDLVAGQGSILIVPPDGDMADYIASLQAIQVLAPVAILPGHGPVITEPLAFLQEYINHRLAREEEILGWALQGYSAAEAIAAQIYKGRPDVLRVATMQVEAHLEKLRKEGRLSSS
jgi:glyoxylase-like metal-dependent hydrolase (beta-lactamase superfamily II)